MSMSSLFISIQNLRVDSNTSATASASVVGGNRNVQCSRVVPADRGSRRITKAWLGSTASVRLGNTATNRPLAESELSSPAAGGITSQSSRSSPETGVVVWPQYRPGPW